MTINELIEKLVELRAQSKLSGSQLVRVSDDNRDGRESDIDDVHLTSNYGEGTYVVLNI